MGKQKKQRFWQHEGFSFCITVVTVSILFIFIGNLMGQYAVRIFGQQQQASALHSQIDRELAQLEATSQPVTKPAEESVSAVVTPATSSLYRVQVGAFSEQTFALALVERLKSEGYEAVILANGSLFRVQTGAFSTLENAERYAAELVHKGFEVTIIRP